MFIQQNIVGTNNLACLRRFDEETYKKLYPTGSRPGMFYGKARVHKLQTGEGINLQNLEYKIVDYKNQS